MEKKEFLNIDFLKEIEKIPETSEKKGWQIEYNKDLDYLYWTQPKISSNSKLISIGDKEFSFYLNPRGKIEGVFFEYFKTNFIKHNNEFKDFSDGLVKEIEEDIFTVKKTKENKKELIHLSNKVSFDILKDVVKIKEETKDY